MKFLEEYNRLKEIVEANLYQYIEHIENTMQGILYDSIKYSLSAGGKRLRPVLHLATIEFLGGNILEYIDSAAALEYIHTYSLIHDDLPAMDNDDFRRGKPTNHKVYGEAIAILSGDALLNTSCEVLLNKIKKSLNINYLEGASVILKSAGIEGMIAGQVVDLESENKKINLKTLEYIHNKKTSALIEASINSAICFMKSEEQIEILLGNYAKRIGLAFQISDDILDVEGDFALLGKTVGSDINNEKSTFVSIYGLKESKKILDSLIEEAIEEIQLLENSDFFVGLAKFILNRKL